MMTKQKDSAEKAIRDIRRVTRRQYSAEEKIHIVLEGLRGESSIAELCRKEGINQNLHCRWSKEFLDAGKGALGDIPLLLMSANPTSEELAQLRSQLTEMMGLSELQADNLMDGLRDSTDQQVALSSRGRQMMMPEGATHMFPYEYPDLVLEEVRKMMRHSAPLEN
jgi:transposase